MTQLALAALAAWALTSVVLAADAPRKERVAFAKGAAQATLNGTIKGDAAVDYVVRAAAGQTLAVKLDTKHTQNNFIVLPPGSTGAAMYSSTMTGDLAYKGVLPTDGDYVVRVFLERAAGRRNESAKYTLTVGVTGTPLPPLPGKQDAKVAGTAYHATAKVACMPPYATVAGQCDAGVIRRGTDGTATVDLRNGQSLRRILFVQGKPVASDGTEPPTATRQGDVTVVKIGDERYDIPDPLLAGG